MYLNVAILVGNLTKDPEIRELPGGTSVASFSIATNRVWKDKNGQKQESADYHNVVVFGNQAKSVAQYLAKGAQVLVEGRMQTRSWDGADGQKKYRTEVVADKVTFGNKSRSGAAPAGVDPIPPSSEPEIEYPEEEINPSDIPF